MVRWGIIGAGGFADRRILPILKEARGCQLEAVMVRDKERARKLAEKYGARRYYDSAEELLQDREIDAVYICTPVYLHKEHTIKAAQRGKHVLCEKPLALNVEEGVEMVKTCREKGVKLMVAFMMRFHPAHREARRIIEEGALGKVVLAHIQNFLWYPPTEGAWRQNPKLGGGGALMDVGSHCIDLLTFLLGKAKRALGIMDNVLFPYPVEDTSVLFLEFERGCRGVVENSFAIPHRENHLEIYGERGSLLISRSIGPYTDFRMRLLSEKGEEVLPLSYENPYRLEFEAFSQCIEEDSPSPITGEEGVENLRIMEAAYTSAEEGKPVWIK